MKLGLSGRLAAACIRSPLTPLFLLVALALGLVAILNIPREEDPQIHVPMVDILVSANGLKAPDAVDVVTKPLETIVKAIPGVDHVYSQTQDDQVMVTAELAGKFEAPIYGMLAVDKLIAEHDWGRLPKPAIRFRGQPTNEATPSLLWDGEWEITYVTFRDMGAAFMAALLGIYILVVAQFRSYKVPLVVLTPVPLTLIGIIPGHWLLDAPFTATSMIGFIALAGIIVRNAILLVDFIRTERASGKALRQCCYDAGAIRFRPILLTALSAMIGAATILSDPIFQGLAISLLFGLLSSTLLTVLVIPALYIVFRGERAELLR